MFPCFAITRREGFNNNHNLFDNYTLGDLMKQLTRPKYHDSETAKTADQWAFSGENDAGHVITTATVYESAPEIGMLVYTRVS